MLESVKRKERENAVAQVRREILHEKEHIIKYGYDSELLSMEHDDEGHCDAKDDMAIYGARATVPPSSSVNVNNVNKNERNDDAFSEMNLDTRAAIASQSSEKSEEIVNNDNGDVQSMIIRAAPKLSAEAQRLEELKQRKVQEQQEEEEERRRKQEIYNEQAAVLTARKTKLSFGFGSKKKLY